MGPAASAASRRDGDLAAPGWDDIGIFHAIAESGSLALAAVRLGLSEATTARRLKAFEQRLGLQLFPPRRQPADPDGGRRGAGA